MDTAESIERRVQALASLVARILDWEQEWPDGGGLREVNKLLGCLAWDLSVAHALRKSDVSCCQYATPEALSAIQGLPKKEASKLVTQEHPKERHAIVAEWREVGPDVKHLVERMRPHVGWMVLVTKDQDRMLSETKAKGWDRYQQSGLTLIDRATDIPVKTLPQ